MNTNYSKSIFLHEDDISSNENIELGFKEKIFSIDENKKTLLIQMSENSRLSNEPITENVEIFVLEGVYSNEFGNFKKGTYLKLPKEQLDKVFCTRNCKIFKKSNYVNDETKVIIDTNTSQWVQGHGNPT